DRLDVGAMVADERHQGALRPAHIGQPVHLAVDALQGEIERLPADLRWLAGCHCAPLSPAMRAGTLLHPPCCGDKSGGMGSGEWGVGTVSFGSRSPFPTPHSPFPIPLFPPALAFTSNTA